MSEPWRRTTELVVECPGCGFTFGAEHWDALADTGHVEATYSCPVCFEGSSSRDDEFLRVLRWLVLERLRYQQEKWDYARQDEAHALEGLTEDSWTWARGVENYVGRVRIAQRTLGEEWWTSPIAVQAYLKLVATLVAMLEHLQRATGVGLPEPGHASGKIVDWSKP